MLRGDSANNSDPMSEETTDILKYFRDFIISLIDIAMHPEFIQLFNMKTSLVISILLEVLDIEEIPKKVKDLDVALSMIWKILLGICQQNLIYDQINKENKNDIVKR